MPLGVAPRRLGQRESTLGRPPDEPRDERRRAQRRIGGHELEHLTQPARSLVPPVSEQLGVVGGDDEPTGSVHERVTHDADEVRRVLRGLLQGAVGSVRLLRVGRE